MEVRTRFAPSPTGFLHVGGARTALYSWLFARNQQGKFILRIEDTDRVRSTDAAINAILEGMAWLGLAWDEGPYYQTQHFDRYNEVIQQLLASGHAYKCYCTKQRLDEMRAAQQKQKLKPRYDGHCRDLPAKDDDQPYVIRFRNPDSGNVVFIDQVYGEISIANSELDDLIIARTDGTPTYNLTVVVDDLDMKISHVIRGDDHINNTPRQINILKALGAEVPIYAHLPMILGPDGKRFSKRHGAVSVLQYKQDGFLPDALINYLVRLGWSSGDQEIFSREEMIAKFSLAGVNKSAASFDNEKLLWLNQQYLKQMPVAEIAELIKQDSEFVATDSPDLTAVIPVYLDRCRTLKDFVNNTKYLYSNTIEYDQAAWDKHINPQVKPILENVVQHLETISDWNVENIKNIIAKVREQYNLKMPQIAQPLRIALTGNTNSPGIADVIFLLGPERVSQRLNAIIAISD